MNSYISQSPRLSHHSCFLGDCGDNLMLAIQQSWVPGLLVLALALSLCPKTIIAQDVLPAPNAASNDFELRADRIGARSSARLDGDFLRVMDSSGKTTTYVRDRGLDSQDGQWLAYVSRESRQVIRWPRQNSGPMQIGSLNGSNVQFRLSQMQIYPQRPIANRTVRRPATPQPQRGTDLLRDSRASASNFFSQVVSSRRGLNPQQLRLVSFDQVGTPWLLTHTQRNQIQFSQFDAWQSNGCDWLVVPVGPSLIRLEAYSRGQVFALTQLGGGRMGLSQLAQSNRQLWRVRQNANGGGVLITSVINPSLCLGFAANQLALQPIQFAPYQLWGAFLPPPSLVYPSYLRATQQQVVVNEPLPPAQLDLVNSQRNALVLLLADQGQGGDIQEIRLEPGESKTIEIARDAGATLVETFETRTLTGWQRHEFRTAIPASPMVDLSVYEVHLQSIAIDRTGKSPKVIEDVNYQPKSVGWIQLPAGAALPIRSQLDVFAEAKRAQNPGAVRRFDQRRLNEVESSKRPLELLLESLQQRPPEKALSESKPSKPQTPQRRRF